MSPVDLRRSFLAKMLTSLVASYFHEDTAGHAKTLLHSF